MAAVKDVFEQQGFATLALRFTRDDLWKLGHLLEYPDSSASGTIGVAFIPNTKTDIGHFVLLLRATEKSVVVFDVSIDAIQEIPFESFPGSEVVVLLVSDSSWKIHRLRVSYLPLLFSVPTWLTGVLLLLNILLVGKVYPPLEEVATKCAKQPIDRLRSLQLPTYAMLGGVLIVSCAWAAVFLNSSFDGAGLVAIPETVNLGVLNVGETEEFKVQLTNNGSTAIDIQDIHMSCACLTVECSITHLEPGMRSECEGKVQVLSAGQKQETVQFHFASQGFEPIVVPIKYTGEVRTRIIPSRVWLGNRPVSDEKIPIRLRFEGTNAKLSLESIETLGTEANVAAEFAGPRSISSGEDIQLAVRVLKAPSSRVLSSKLSMKGTLSIGSEDSPFEQVIDVFCQIANDVTYSPRSIYLFTDTDQQSQNVRLLFARPGIEVVRAAPNVPGISATVEKSTNPNESIIHVKAESVEGSLEGTLTIELSDPSMGQLSIPVVAVNRR